MFHVGLSGPTLACPNEGNSSKLDGAMKVALSGITSFTGCHIAHALGRAGHEVLALLTRPAEDYITDSMSQLRIGHARQPGLRLVYEAPFGSPRFLEAIASFAPEVLINHGAAIKGYRSPDFDGNRSAESSLLGLTKVLEALRAGGGKGVVHSGTVFEPIDGLPALSPYGASKKIVADALQAACQDHGLSFSKIFIANPIGPFENEDRLIPVFARKWQAGEVPHLSVPRVAWDNVPAPWLAKVYVAEAERLARGESGRICRPSGFCLSLAEFLALFAQQAARWGNAPALPWTEGENLESPAPRFNTQPCPELASPVAVAEFFDTWFAQLWPLPEAR